MERRSRRGSKKDISADDALNYIFENMLRECICYGMKPNEFWQTHPQDVFHFLAINRPPLMRGHLTKKRYDELFKKLDDKQAEESAE